MSGNQNISKIKMCHKSPESIFDLHSNLFTLKMSYINSLIIRSWKRGVKKLMLNMNKSVAFTTKIGIWVIWTANTLIKENSQLALVIPEVPKYRGCTTQCSFKLLNHQERDNIYCHALLGGVGKNESCGPFPQRNAHWHKMWDLQTQWRSYIDFKSQSLDLILGCCLLIFAS